MFHGRARLNAQPANGFKEAKPRMEKKFIGGGFPMSFANARAEFYAPPKWLERLEKKLKEKHPKISRSAAIRIALDKVYLDGEIL